MRFRRSFFQSLRLLLILGVVLGCLIFFGASEAIPVTSTQLSILPVEKENALPDMQTFIASVTNGHHGIPAGVYVPGVLALKIVQQPKDDPAFVSALPDILTQFQMASRYLTVGLLAHNFLAGTQFFKIHLNQEIVLVFGDGKVKNYSVSDIKSYQALSPNDPYSNFVSSDGQKNLSSEDVFKEVYAKGNQLVFQTSIQKGNEDSWGRLFIIANELNTVQVKSFNLSDYISVTHFSRAVVGTD